MSTSWLTRSNASRLTARLEDLPPSVWVTRSRHPPLRDRLLRGGLGAMRRHEVIELLLEMCDGSKSLIPAAWTDAEPVSGEGGIAVLRRWGGRWQICCMCAS